MSKNIHEVVKENYPMLNPTERQIWNYISQNKEKCLLLSIYELAKICHVSHTTIMRFTQKLGFHGYGEFKTVLKWSLQQNIRLPDHTISYLRQDYQLLSEAMMSKDLHNLFEHMDHAKELYAYGIGTVQKHACMELKRTFLYANKLIHAIEGDAECNSLLQTIQAGDVIFIYPSEEDADLLKQFAQRLQEKAAYVVYVCRLGSEVLFQDGQEIIGFHQRKISIDARVYESSAPYFIIAELLLVRYLQYHQDQLLNS